jgi:hypothetical protein
MARSNETSCAERVVKPVGIGRHRGTNSVFELAVNASAMTRTR